MHLHNIFWVKYFNIWWCELHFCMKIRLNPSMNISNPKNSYCCLLFVCHFKLIVWINEKPCQRAKTLTEIYIFRKKYVGFFIAGIKVSQKFFSAFFKIIFYTISLNKEKKEIYLHRLSGLVNSILGRSSWHRPTLDWFIPFMNINKI